MRDNSKQCVHVPDSRDKDAVDTTKLDVDLEAKVGEGLRGGTEDVLHLDTLRGHTQQCVTNSLYFSWSKRVR